MPSLIFNIKEMARVAYSQNPNIKLIADTTNDDPWGPTCQQMDEVCRAYRMGGETSEEIMGEIVLRLENRKDSWRRCYKSLLLLDHMARTLPERQVRDLDRVIPLLSTISRNFAHTDSKGVDQGINIRERAKKLLHLLQDKEYLKEERKKSAVTAAKVGGMGGDFGGGGIGNSSEASGGGRFSGTGSNVHSIAAEEGGGIANRQNTYGAGGLPYDAYSTPTTRGSNNTTTPIASRASPPPPSANGGKPLSREEQEQADMAFAARLQQEEERRAGTRVTDTDIGRKLAAEGQKEKEQRDLAEWQRKQAQMMAGRGGKGTTTPPPAAPSPPSPAGGNAMDLEARMALELQARLDRGEDMETAIATIQAKYEGKANSNSTNNSGNPSASSRVAGPTPQTRPQQGTVAAATVIDPFAAPAPQQPQQPQPQQQKVGGAAADLDFFSDIPQGNLSAKNAQQQQQQRGGTVDDLFGGASTTSPAAVRSNTTASSYAVNTTNTAALDFFGNPIVSSAPQQQQQQPSSAIDFFGNASPNPTNSVGSSNPPPAANANDFFADPFAFSAAPANKAASSAPPSASDPFSALTKAQQDSIDALSGGGNARRQQQMGSGGGAFNNNSNLMGNGGRAW